MPKELMKKMKSAKMKDMYDSMKSDYYPSFSLDSKTVPELEDKKVGAECYLMIKVKVDAIHSSSKSTKYSLEVMEAAAYVEKGDDEYES